MNILIVGSGGREHALAWKAARSDQADTVFVAPGNAGTALEAGIENIDISADDIDSLIAFARDTPVGLTIVGPEVPLVAGIVDRFTAGRPALLWADSGSRAAGRFEVIQQGFPGASRDTDRGLCDVYRDRAGLRLYPRAGRTHCRQGRWSGRRQGRHHCAIHGGGNYRRGGYAGG